MSYFDHVRCPQCNASMKPEEVQSGSGRARCVHCNAELGLVDFFGVSAAFSEAEEAEPTIDDLVPGFGASTPSAKSSKSAPTTDEMVESTKRPSDPLDVLDALRAMKKKRR